MTTARVRNETTPGAPRPVSIPPHKRARILPEPFDSRLSRSVNRPLDVFGLKAFSVEGDATEGAGW